MADSSVRRPGFKVILDYTRSSREELQRETVSQKKKRERIHGERGREKRGEEEMGEEQEEGGERKGLKGRYAFLPKGV